MPTESAPLTVFDAVRRAVNACDPDATSAAGADDALARFEDRDEPLAGLEDPDRELAEVFGALDPQAEDPQMQMIPAVATYLAFLRDEGADSDESLIALAARAEYRGSPPEHVRAWLDERRVSP